MNVDDEDPLRAARGCIHAALIGIVLWIVIITLSVKACEIFG